jgi:hypothetical protein
VVNGSHWQMMTHGSEAPTQRRSAGGGLTEGKQACLGLLVQAARADFWRQEENGLGLNRE